MRHGLWELCPGTKVLVWVCLPSLLALTRLNQDYKAKHLRNIISTVLTGRCTPKKGSGPSLFLCWELKPQACFSPFAPSCRVLPSSHQPAVSCLEKASLGSFASPRFGPVRHCFMPLAPSPSAWALPWGQLVVCVACPDTAPRTAGDGTRRHGAPNLLPQHQGLCWACWQEVEAREEQLPRRTEAQRGQEDPAEEQHGVSQK